MTAIARIFYMGSDTEHDTYKNGLALALADDVRDLYPSGENWSNAMTIAAAHTPKITGSGEWLLPSVDQWGKMETGAGSATALRDGFESVGGTNLSGQYWTSKENSETNAFYIYYSSLAGRWDPKPNSKDNCCHVRACLVF